MDSSDHPTTDHSEEKTDGACLSLATSKKKSVNIVAQMVTHRYSPYYKMDHKKLGDALIFSHEIFATKDEIPQTKKGSAKLASVLQLLGFNVTIYPDLRHKKLVAAIKDAARKDRSDHDCILVAILTNGDSTDILHAKDLPYKLEDIWQIFADECHTLAGKPKIFIVDSCLGKHRDAGHGVVPYSGQTQTDSDSKSNYRIPRYADFLIASYYYTVPEHCQLSNAEDGSWFINDLCEELKASGKDLHILHLLTFVAQRISCRGGYEKHQNTCTMSTLTRILCLSGDRKN